MANWGKNLIKRIVALAAIVALALPGAAFAARTSVDWVNQSGTTYIQPNFGLNGVDLLILGSNRYLNFNTVTGTSGYGFRDNGGTMEFKNSGGAWTGIGTGGGGSSYPFSLPGNATSTLTQFNGGITAYGTSTIGAGGNTTGLTISGGATTTGTFTVSSQSTGCAQFSSLGVLTSNGVACGTGTSAAYPFLNITFGSGVPAAGTSTVFFPSQLASGSSTIGKIVATSSITNQGVTGALVLNSAAGLEGAYGGSNPCVSGSSVAFSFSATGVVTCGNAVPYSFLNITFGAGILAAGTSTVLFPAQLAAGSSTVGTIVATSSVTNKSVTSALVLNSSTGLEGAYGGASVCASNNFVTALSAVGGTTCGTASISGISLGSNLAAHTTNASLTGTSYNGSAAVSDWGINLANSNTFSVGQIIQASSTIFQITSLQSTTTNATSTTEYVSNGITVLGSSTFAGNATTSGTFFASIASSTKTFGASLTTCNSASSALTWNAGTFGCNSITSGSSFPFSNIIFGAGVNAAGTSTVLFPAQLAAGSSTVGTLVATTSITNQGVVGALVLANASGLQTTYGGTNPCNAGSSVAFSISATGIVTCGNAVPYSFSNITFGAGILAAGTSTVLFPAQFAAGSSTIGSLTATSSITNTSVKSALVLNSATGLEGAYAGTGPCGGSNFMIALSAAGSQTCGTATISGVLLGSSLNSLTHDSSLGGTSYNGSAAISDWGINLANSNTFSAGQIIQASSTIFQITSIGATSTNATTTTEYVSAGLTAVGSSTFAGNATTSGTFFANIASSTKTFGAGLTDCAGGTNALNWTAATGLFSCNSISVSGSVGNWFTPVPLFGATVANSTSTLIGFTNGIYALASSTIGAGGLTTGLTISGGATTTGIAYFGSNVGIGSTTPYALVGINAPGGSAPLLAIGSSTSEVMSVYSADHAILTMGTGTPWAQFSINPTNLNRGSPSFAIGSTTLTQFEVLNNGNVGVATATAGTLFSIGGSANFTTATSTFASTGGINLNAGCFAIRGTCVSGSGGGVTSLAANEPAFVSGSTGAVTITINRDWIVSALNGSLSPTSTTRGIIVNASSTIGNGAASGGLTISGNSTTTGQAYITGRLGVNDQSPDWSSEIAGSSGNGYFGITNSSDGDILNINTSGNVGIASTTPGTIFSIGTSNGINLSATATSTFGTGGINILTGCFAIRGTCLSTSGSGLTTISGPTGITWSGTPTATGVLSSGYSIKELPTWTVAAAGADFTTIQAALTQCGTSGGGSIYLLDATYNQGGTGLTFRGSSCNVYGRSNGTTTINFTGATTGFKTNSAAGVYSHNGLHNMVILGDGTAGSIAIDMSDMNHALYENIQTDNWDTVFRLNDTQNTTFYNKVMNTDSTTIKSFGIDASSTKPANDNTFENMFIGCSNNTTNGCVAVNLNNDQANTFNQVTMEPGGTTKTTGVQIRSSNLATNNGTFDNVFYNAYIEGNKIGVSASSTDNRSGNAAVHGNNFFGGQIETNTTNTVFESADQIEGQFSGTEVNFTSTNTLGPVTVIAKNRGNMFFLNDQGASNMAFFAQNNTNFAHNSLDFTKVALLNGSDSSNLLNLSNAGTGATIIATSSRGTDLILRGSNGYFGIATATPSSAMAVGISATTPTFSAWTTGSSSPSLFIDSANNNGRIGIGTSSPNTSYFATLANTFGGGGLLINTWTNTANAFAIKNTTGSTVFNVDTTNATGAMFGIGTSTPFASLSIHANAVDTNKTLFAIASSTSAATTTLFLINNWGDIITAGTAPTVTGCGTQTITATSTDYRGHIIVTAGTPTTCNITFSRAKTDTPMCIVNDNSSALAVGTKLASTTGFQITMAAAFSGEMNYLCVQ